MFLILQGQSNSIDSNGAEDAPSVEEKHGTRGKLQRGAKIERQVVSASESHEGVTAVEHATAYISAMLKQKEFLQMISLIDQDYGEIAEVFGAGVESRSSFREVRRHMCDVFTTFPLGAPQYIIVHHENSIVTFGKSARGIWVMALAPSSSSPGMLNLIVKQITGEIDLIMGGRAHASPGGRQGA